LGIGVLAEMAFEPKRDAGLCQFGADHLFAPCTTWMVLRRESVPRDYTLDFIELFGPHLERRAVRHALGGAAPPSWPQAPHWRERQLLSRERGDDGVPAAVGQTGRGAAGKTRLNRHA
ncbi:MAG: hypothetical protein LBU72_06480, partial [Burkholderiaceae bacterium]|nr:hypothetical protein [Burkholderiaceae bacterium]